MLGVPQGSILGPLLFLIYNLSRASAFFRYILFADDTNLFASGKDKRALFRGVNFELGKLSDWFAHKRLTLNYSKTEFVDFSKLASNTSVGNYVLKVDGNLIREVPVSKFLGVSAAPAAPAAPEVQCPVEYRGYFVRPCVHLICSASYRIC